MDTCADLVIDSCKLIANYTHFKGSIRISGLDVAMAHAAFPVGGEARHAVVTGANRTHCILCILVQGKVT